MITQNILDSLGAVIGTLSFPDGTDQSTINATLALYAQSSPTPLVVEEITTTVLSQLSNTTTSAASPTVMAGMSLVPPAGTYIVSFSGSVNTGGASASGTFGIYVNGSLLPETNRPISCNITLLGGLVTISVNSIGVGTYTGTQITLDGNSTLDIRFASTNGGTIGFTERVLTLIQVAG
jgi:hypothetical protein